MGFSPLAAGLTALAFSIGSFLLAPMAVPLAQKHGRLVLCSGGVAMALGMVGVVLGAGHVGHASNPWPIVPGLVLAGVGLSMLVIPLANVVLAAVPHEAASGAGGIFSTAQQLGGAVGVAVVGTMFFSRIEHHSLTAAFKHSAPVVIALFAAAGLLSLMLPRTAVSEQQLAEV